MPSVPFYDFLYIISYGELKVSKFQKLLCYVCTKHQALEFIGIYIGQVITLDFIKNEYPLRSIFL